MLLRPVIQEDPSGCGIATVAALVGITYQEARTVANNLGIYAEDRALWPGTESVRLLLAHYVQFAPIGETPFFSWDSLPDLALLAIKWRFVKKNEFWHWALFIRDFEGTPVVFDSKKDLRSNVRRDFGRMKPKWFIPIIK